MTDRIADCRLELSHYMPQHIMLIQQETQHIEQSQSSFSPHVDELDSQFEHFGNVAFIEMSGIAARSRSPPRM